MEIVYQNSYFEVEKDFWWFVARRKMVLSLVNKHSLQKKRPLKILEIGISSGLLLSDLKKLGHQVTGIDISTIAIQRAKEVLGLDDVFVMDGIAPQFDKEFDLILASDVLEHLEDDATSIRNWRKLLSDEGKLIIFVPAMQFLWSEFDVINHHFRRYSLSSLRLKVEKENLKIKDFGYWNFFLFPLVLLHKFFLVKKKKIEEYQLEMPSSLLNGLLKTIMNCENFFLAMGFKPPLGVSCFVVAEK